MIALSECIKFYSKVCEIGWIATTEMKPEESRFGIASLMAIFHEITEN